MNRKAVFSNIKYFLLSLANLFIFLIAASRMPHLRGLAVFSSVCIALNVLLMLLKNKAISCGVLFYLCLILMHCGQIFIIAFGWDFSSALKSSIAISNNISSSEETVRITTIGCLIISSVLLLFERSHLSRTNNHKQTQLKRFNNTIVGFSDAGWTIVIAVFMLACVSDVVRAIQVFNYGYSKGFQQSNILLYYCDLLYPLFLFTTISIYRNNSKVLTFSIALTIVRSVFSMFFIGSRGEAVLDVLLCVFAVISLSSNIKYIKSIKKVVAICFVSAIIVLPFTGLLRSNRDLSLVEFLVDYNPISYSLTEFGGSIINVRLGMEHSGSLPLESFFNSFQTILPLSTSLNPSVLGNYGNAYAMYLNSLYNGSLHLGGSLIGEAVFWFGDGAGFVIYLSLFALILSLLFRILNGNGTDTKLIVFGPSFFLVHQMFYQIRGSISSFQTGMKLLLYFVIILYFFRNLFFKRGYYVETRYNNNEQKLHRI